MLILAVLCSSMAFSLEPDILVTQDGESLKVYNLDMSPTTIFYTLSEIDDAPVQRIQKADVLIIKKADGSVITASETAAINMNRGNVIENPHQHESETVEANSAFFKDKKGNAIIEVLDVNGHKLFMRLTSEKDKSLAVTKWQGKGKYNHDVYQIPEHVIIGNEKFTVTSIDDKAFEYLGGLGGLSSKIKDIILPNTLVLIGERSFLGQNGLRKIIIPENVKTIKKDAFYASGSTKNFEQIYIPKGVREIGKDAFGYIGPHNSPRHKTQAYFSSIPDFINPHNSEYYGIDDSSVEDYEKRNSKN